MTAPIEKTERQGAATRNGSPELCPHGGDKADVCLACVQESSGHQPAWGRIEELLKTSKYERSPEGPECTITGGGASYEIRLVKARDIDLIKKVHVLMEETFDEDEIDPVEVTRAAIGGTLPDGSKDLTRYRIFVALDKDGEVASVFAGGLLEVVFSRPGSVAEAMFMEAYAATRVKSLRLGLFRELYLSSLMQAAADAEAERKRLIVAVGECTWRSEPAWNAIGQKRIYLENGTGQYIELTYIQPPVDWDPETGKAADGAGNVPEHLMIEFFEGEPGKDRLIAAIDAIYRWNNRLPRNFFASSEAYALHRKYVDGQLNLANSFLLNHGHIILLTATQRNEARDHGTRICEHTVADVQSGSN